MFVYVVLLEKPIAVKDLIASFAIVVIIFEVVIEVIRVFIVSDTAEVTDIVSGRISHMLFLGSLRAKISVTSDTLVELVRSHLVCCSTHAAAASEGVEGKALIKWMAGGFAGFDHLNRWLIMRRA